MNEITTTAARAELSEIVNRVRYGNERIGLTRRGKVVAVVVSPTAAAVLDKLEDMFDDLDALEAIADGGGSITLAQLKNELAGEVV